ncbi:NEDD4 family-interacting protein 2-like [Phascolarctos cinereus]|uniref:NEDD4 family-interacting protein 2-like n=1 Tax=Phascolarctos cinereus TaxID=38626 RepID=A0A6P5L6V0_PHACI|nr:NEDD4 family-interacting protein 2-like [Phascolarctos cinereus]
MDLHPSVTSRYQVLRNEENDREPPAVEQPSTPMHITPMTAPPTPATSPSAPGPPLPEWSPSPLPYGPFPAKAQTSPEPKGPCEPFPVPPPYSVATSLPSYDEAERAKAAALAASAGASREPSQGEDVFSSREASTISDPDPLRVGNDGIFMVAFFMAFIFNWVGFCLSFCTTSSIAGRYGALCGFGLSLTKWILIVRFSDYFPLYFNGQYWLWWIFLLISLLLFFRGFYSYLKVRNMSERLATANRTRYIFAN